MAQVGFFRRHRNNLETTCFHHYQHLDQSHETIIPHHQIHLLYHCLPCRGHRGTSLFLFCHDLQWDSFRIISKYPLRNWLDILKLTKYLTMKGGEKDLLSIHLPNALNVTFYFPLIILGIMLLYIPLFPPMYLHMFAQRKKVLGTSHKLD